MAVLNCHLCGQPANAPVLAEGLPFCCHGCRELWRILGEEHLEKLRSQSGLRWDLVREMATDAPAASPPPSVGAPETAHLGLDGLWCVSCAALVEHVVRRQSGVLGCHVDYAASSADVAYDSAVVSLGDLQGTIRRLGYAASVRQESSMAQTALLRRLGGAAVLAAVVMMFSVVIWTGDLPSLPPGLRDALAYGLWALATPAVFWAGWPFLRGAWTGLVHGVPTMDLLVALGSLSAYGISIVAVLRGGRYLYFDISCMLVAFLLLGRALESATQRAASEVTRLLAKLAAKDACLWRDGREISVPVAQLAVGDLVVVRPGAKVPVDGIVTSGESAVDASVITGEAVPVDCRPGTMVYAGSVNGQGRLVLEATRVGRDTVLRQTAHAVAAALARKGAWQRLADRVVAVFVPFVLTCGVATFLYWHLQGHLSLPAAALRAIAVLVIACPCALGVGTPLGVAAAARAAARHGLLLRSGEAMERAARIDTVLLDKTGTVTDGRMHLIDCLPPDPQILGLAGALEEASEHPIARAVAAAARARALPLPAVERFREITGRGVVGRVDGRRIRVGQPSRHRTLPPDLRQAAQRWEGQGLTTLWVQIDGQVKAVLAVGDHPRPEAAEAVSSLRRMGMDVALITGDAEGTAAAVAGAVGIPSWSSRTTPTAKAEIVAAMQAAGHRVAFVGDGINDAAALAQADLGLALASGADIAVQAGEITLVRPDLREIPVAITLARRSTRVIRQNLAWALGYNALALPVAAVGWARPVVAAGAMVASSIFILASSLRLTGRSTGRWVASAAAVAGLGCLLWAVAWWGA